MDPRAAQLIERLALVPHPEGGHYREIQRSALRVRPLDGRGERAATTGIYFLLAAGEHSRWHRVASDETWHHYEGDALELLVAAPGFEFQDCAFLRDDPAAAARLCAAEPSLRELL